MTILKKVLILCLTLPLACTGAAAQGFVFGTFQSFRGAGLIMETAAPQESDFNCFALYADLADMYLGNAGAPGIKFNFSHNIRIAEFSPQTVDELCLFAGSGFSAGWVTDTGREGYGLCAALSGTFGARAEFSYRLVFTLGLTLETGGLLYREDAHLKSSLYRNGIYQTVMPNLTIAYRFK